MKQYDGQPGELKGGGVKPYFCKYLPVPGEIKKGDAVQMKDGRIGYFESFGSDTGMSMIRYLDGNVDIEDEYKKVKLFLCSRDIQVGDRVRFVARPDVETTVSEPLFENYINDGVGMFKVIGEISSGAIWVKEGDEFEEEEIKCGPMGERTHTVENPDGTFNATYEFHKIVKIKCPTCKFFH